MGAIRKKMPKWSSGKHVTLNLKIKLSKVVDGKVKPGEMMELGPGSAGRVVDVVKEKPRLVYLVKFALGDAYIAGQHLVALTDSTLEISKNAMKKADPDLKVDVTPIEDEPGYD
jgi:hypothetical protein